MAGGTFTISNVSQTKRNIAVSSTDFWAGGHIRFIDGHTHHQFAADRYFSDAQKRPSSMLTEFFLLAVLGLHAIKEKPVAIAGKVEIRPVGVQPG